MRSIMGLTRRVAARGWPGRVGRIASPAGLTLVLLGFTGGFLLVSCDTPGGYGRLERGGTTTYTGVQLATGQAPTVDPEHLRPAGEQEPDRLPAQPLLVVSAVLVVAAGAIAIARRRNRHELTSAFAAGAAFTLTAGVLHARTLLVDRLASQADGPWPRGRTATDYVQFGQAFWPCVLVLGLVAVGHFLAALRLRGRMRGDGDTAHDGAGPPAPHPVPAPDA